MKSISNPIAQQAYARALRASRTAPTPRKKTLSSTADKFVIRGYVELFHEMAAIGLYQGRSANSETVAAILEAIDGYSRSDGLTKILKRNLGEDLARNVLDEVPAFDLSLCETRKKFVVRFPDEIRDRVRNDLNELSKKQGGSRQLSMNTWLLNALVRWIKIQREQYALLSAGIAFEQSLLSNDARPGPADSSTITPRSDNHETGDPAVHTRIGQ